MIDDSLAAVEREQAPLVGASHSASTSGSDAGEVGASERRRVPRSVYFIISNEICERFSFYALKSILALYLHEQLRFSEDAGRFLSKTCPSKAQACLCCVDLRTNIFLKLAFGLSN